MLASVQPGEGVLNRTATREAGGQAGIDAMNRGGRMGGPTVVNMVYKHRIFDSFVRDNLAKGGPLSQAVQGRRRVGHRGKG